MKGYIKYLLLITIFLAVTGIKAGEPVKYSDAEIEKKVNELLSKMTLEEKVGQMTQIALDALSKREATKDQDHEVDESKLRNAIVNYHVGSILNVYNRSFSPAYWQKLITKIQDIALKETKIKIPVLYGIDAIHGVSYTEGATLFPQGINMAATWNRELALKAGEITAAECRASGIPWNFYPVLDIGRQPLWSRLWETYGEDVYLASEMGRNYIEGMQGDDISADDKVAACLKHYVGYSLPATGKDRTPAYIPERQFREYCLPPFEAGVKAGVLTVMVNSGEIDGIPTHSDPHILKDILHDELKFKGFACSDWEDIIKLYSRDRVAETPKDAVRIAVMAGVDMSMVPMDFSFYNYLIELVKEGSVPESRINEAVSRILMVKVKLGLFDKPYPNPDMIKQVGTEEHTQVNREAAREAVVLAKNDKNILPLSKDAKILVTGPTANLLSVLNGGWTITWQGNVEELYPKQKNTVLEALQKQNSNVTYVEDSSFTKDSNHDAALKAAKDADVIVLCLGEHTYCETPGNINDLNLEDSQIKFAEQMFATGKPVVLIMLEGRPRIINKIVDKASAVLLGFLPGMEGGDAIADIMYGNVNPSGKLSITYPRYANSLTLYDHKPLEEYLWNVYDPQWPFGFGLSYTTYEYSNLKLDKETIKNGENVKVTVDVKNTGKMAGKEAVQLYLTDLFGSVSRPVKQIKGFEKIYLEPGETKTVSFTITPDELSFIGRDYKRTIEPGEFTVTIDKLTKNFRLQ